MTREMSDEEKEAQRRSFARGNVGIHNPEAAASVDEAAERLARKEAAEARVAELEARMAAMVALAKGKPPAADPSVGRAGAEPCPDRSYEEMARRYHEVRQAVDEGLAAVGVGRRMHETTPSALRRLLKFNDYRKRLAKDVANALVKRGIACEATPHGGVACNDPMASHFLLDNAAEVVAAWIEGLLAKDRAKTGKQPATMADAVRRAEEAEAHADRAEDDDWYVVWEEDGDGDDIYRWPVEIMARGKSGGRPSKVCSFDDAPSNEAAEFMASAGGYVRAIAADVHWLASEVTRLEHQLLAAECANDHRREASGSAAEASIVAPPRWRVVYLVTDTILGSRVAVGILLDTGTSVELVRGPLVAAELGGMVARMATSLGLDDIARNLSFDRIPVGAGPHFVLGKPLTMLASVTNPRAWALALLTKGGA